MTPTRHPSRRRRPAALAVLAALGLAALTPGAAVAGTPRTAVPAAAVPAAAASDKVADALDAQLADGGPTTFWVTVAGDADLSAADELDTKAAKGAYVRRTLIADTDRAQDDVREFLHDRDADFTPFWIANVIHVTGDRDLVADLARRPDVVRLEPDAAPEAPPAPGTPAPTAADGPGVTWNVRRIGADRVWDELGVRGEGVVIANIDTGVEFDHPALLGSYRGHHSSGHVTHDYSWFDASGDCPAGVPCDENGHGTHVMGIQVGATADGAYQTGVAPGARWIAARADTMEDKLEAGQWMLAPTDQEGRNPRPDLAPDVVNNSWRYNEPEFYADMLAAWVAAGIFPTFGAGNDGASRACETVAWPTSLADAYAVGNTDSSDAINASSSRGPTSDGRIKPDISAPGTDILSASWTGGYELMTGTSMAAPAVAGAVALLWSAAPELDGDVAATRAVLDGTAHPLTLLDCGGTAELNNVAGHGLLDVYAAVQAAPRAGLGGVRTVVREAGTRRPLADATVVLTGPRDKVITTGADGVAQLDRMLPGEYAFEVTTFGHETATGRVTVPAGPAPTVTLTVDRVPSGKVTGVVRGADGAPVAGATVAVVGSPASVRTGTDGRYRLTVPTGTAALDVTTPDRCSLPARRTVEVAARTTVDLTLDPRTDPFGYTCTLTGEYRAGDQLVPVTGQQGAAQEVPLPFPVTVYGQTFASAWITTDGVIGFGAAPRPDWSDQMHNLSWRETLPRFEPDTALYPFHTLLDVDAQAGVYTAQTEDTFVVEWRDVAVLQPGGAPGGRLSFSATLHRDGRYTFAYRDVEPGAWTAGRNAVIGVGDAVSYEAWVYANLEAVVTDGLALTITPPTS
ncbi:S8 family serine peptidase [Cellulomonas sp. S1-8]|uniref:S8 family serine peptidase n=1 Tax=Cellulomonas sp. S1-8 TaxID=2904790 RepID=UPI00224459EE|nr:S8 family serine peptidase [Cellulomonas sp. S1-8]UZN03286.1 S8 family serine peptidase [Cellulomonas sp. S1-8]